MVRASDRLDVGVTETAILPKGEGEGAGSLIATRGRFILEWLVDLEPPLGFGVLGPPGGGKSVLLEALSDLELFRRDPGTQRQPDPREGVPPLRIELVTAASLVGRAGLLEEVPVEESHSLEERLARCLVDLLGAKGGPVAPILLVDEADKGTPEEVGRLWLTLARLLHALRPRPARERRADGASVLPAELARALGELRVVLAYDEPRLVDALARFLGAPDAARALVAEVACQVYFVAFDPEMKTRTLEVLRREVGSGPESDGSAPPRFLATLEEEALHADLRASRQVLALLNKLLGDRARAEDGFLRRITRWAEKRLREKWRGGAARPKTLPDGFVVPAVALLVLARGGVPREFREWTVQAWDLDPLVYLFERVETAFLGRRVGGLPDPAALRGALEYVRVMGFRETVAAVERDGCPFLSWYRRAREQLLVAWNDAFGQTRRQLDLLFLFSSEPRDGERVLGVARPPGTVTTALWEGFMNA